MVKMGTVWDRTVEVLNGRTGMIAPIALLGIVLPAVVRDGFVTFSTPGSALFALFGSVLSIAVLVLMIWSQLAIVAIATDPATNAAQARRQASARVLPAIGITVLLTIVAMIVVLPPIFVLIQSGFDFPAAMRGSAGGMTPPSGGAVAFIGLYALVYLLALIWIGARLILLNPVILNERRGLGALRRSVRLTKGLTWRIIGVLILFAIVLLVTTWAAQSVTGVVFRLALGADGLALATYLSGIFATIVSTAFTVLAAVFTTQLYVAVRESPDPL